MTSRCASPIVANAADDEILSFCGYSRSEKAISCGIASIARSIARVKHCKEGSHLSFFERRPWKGPCSGSRNQPGSSNQVKCVELRRICGTNSGQLLPTTGGCFE